MPRTKITNDMLIDPVAAYDRIAASYPEIAARRRKYLDRIDHIIVKQVPHGSRSLLDVGAGDGERALLISAQAGLREVALLEPSSGMRSRMKPGPEILPICLEQVNANHALCKRRFDVITCLWNVLGHIKGGESRVKALSQLAQSLATNGILFMDVNHRYNTAAYGLWRTLGRFVWDQLHPDECNGDVTVTWTVGGGAQHCSTYGHVFTAREVSILAKRSGLLIEKKIIVDYEDGRVRRFGFSGNLLYVLRPKNCASDSASVPQTSSTSASVI